MVEQKVTLMVVVLKVDLDCTKCYKKVKKILCAPEIRDKVYDMQKNLVRISVVCCSPERIRDKLCCKGRKVIQSIDIVPLPKPIAVPAKSPDHPPKKSTPTLKQTAQAAPAYTQTQSPTPNPSTTRQGSGGLVLGIAPPQTQPPGTFPFGPQCFQGYGGGRCYYDDWYLRHVLPPPPNYGNYYGCGFGSDYHSEENTSGCTIL